MQGNVKGAGMGGGGADGVQSIMEEVHTDRKGRRTVQQGGWRKYTQEEWKEYSPCMAEPKQPVHGNMEGVCGQYADPSTDLFAGSGIFQPDPDRAGVIYVPRTCFKNMFV